MEKKILLTTPVVRIVQGDIYNPSTKDMKGSPLVYKTGADAGKPRVDHFLRIAIPKNPGETHWSQSPFGQKIWAAGAQFWNGNTSLFWKIEDGDDATPNLERKGKKNCDHEGWSGNWVLKLGGAFAPKLVHLVGSEALPLTEEGFIKCGDYIEIYLEVASNNDVTKPGLLYNAAAICFRSHGESIYSGVDVSAAGFGQAAMPANAKVQTFAAAMDNGFSTPPPPAIPVIPNIQFAGIVAPPVTHVMTPLAKGATYEQLITMGYTDALLISQGLMVA